MTRRLLLILTLCACSPRPKSRCEEVCATEAECADRLDIDVDQAECVEWCAALEKSARAEVDAHLTCVAKASADCAAILQCP